MHIGISALLVSAFLLPAAAHADTFDFTLNGGGDNFTFAIDPVNTPSFNADGTIFYTTTVADTDTGNTDISDFVAFNPTSGSQTIGFSEDFFTLPVDIFDGTNFIPTADGSPDVADLFGDPGSPYALTITDASATPSATPEPSSLALLGTGILGAFATARRRYAR